MDQKIIPSVWHVGTAVEAAEFYTDVIPDTRVVSTSYYPTEGLLDFQEPLAGQALTVEIDMSGFRSIFINAGNDFAPTPAISYMVNFDPLFFGDDEHLTRTTLTEMWERLSDGGTVLMELGTYPFSQLYGWVADKYGMTWQLILSDPAGEPRPFIMPAFLFVGDAQDRAAAAIDRYSALFEDAERGSLVLYEEPTGTAGSGAVMFADFTLNGQWFVAMDAAADTPGFTPGVSLVIRCEDQAEIDHFWVGLSRVPEAEQCGWCCDEFGVSWQIEPHNIAELLERPGAFERLLEMSKIVIDEL